MATMDGLIVLGGVNVLQFTGALAAVAVGCWLYARLAKRIERAVGPGASKLDCIQTGPSQRVRSAPSFAE